MKQNDTQVGSPGILYSGTKAAIEAAFSTAGQTAYATDTNQWGYYNGSNWVWGSGATYVGVLPIVVSGSAISHNGSGSAAWATNSGSAVYAVTSGSAGYASKITDWPMHRKDIPVGSPLTIPAGFCYIVGPDFTINDTLTNNGDLILVQGQLMINGIIVISSGSATTYALAAATGSHKIYYIKNIGAGACTVDGNGADTIDGETTQQVDQWESMQIYDYGVGTWLIL